MEQKAFLTKEGYEKLVEELKELKDEKLPAVLARLKDAIGQGDISENSEYDTALSDKDLIENRIVHLQELLKNVEIIEENTKASEARYGSRIKIQDEKGKIYDFYMVGTGEVDILEGKISFNSPLGQAIKGKRKGDKVTFKVPKGKKEITILELN